MEQMESYGSKAKTSAPRNLALYVAAVALLVVLVGVGYIIASSKAPKLSGSYQAVFLSNGQVYFGKVSRLAKHYATLTDVFYLRLQKPLQSQQKDEEGKLIPEPQPSLTLIKLGNELHGPFDEMVINRDQILFVESLKEDSKVVKAITEFKKQPASSEKKEESSGPINTEPKK